MKIELGLALGEGIAACPISRPRLRRLVLRSLTEAGAVPPQGAAIHLLLCDRREAMQLNRAHRGRRYAPNVLSFEYPPLKGQPLSADIAICLPVVEDEARQQGKSMQDHFMHMVVHGCLHACGLDHLEQDQAQHMEAIERRVLRAFRIADPYA